MYNYLPDNLKCIEKLNEFKIKVTEFLLADNFYVITIKYVVQKIVMPTYRDFSVLLTPKIVLNLDGSWAKIS
jgi:hypothetical protein